MTTVLPIRLDLKAPIATADAIDGERVTQGSPRVGHISAYDQPEKGIYMGQWASEPGAWKISYTEDELVVILLGRGELVSDDGSVFAYKAGDAFVIPSGFKGQWVTLESTRKIYSITHPIS
jgi:uncharacterized cupin superfamily protein